MNQNPNTKPKIADYDASNYDYETYWKGRDYEDQADKIALERLLKRHVMEKKMAWYIDIGGSYGRETSVYAKSFDQVILFDYSINSLKKGKAYLDKKGIKNVTYVAGNLYFLPFKEKSIDGGQIIRVMHHIKEPDTALKEISRVINTFFILEFANKIHAKFVLRTIAKGNFSSIQDKEPIQQIFRGTSQGSKGDDQIFLNHHPLQIKAILEKTDFMIAKELSVSNFRSPTLKKIIPISVLAQSEIMLQPLLAPFSFGPSMYFDLVKKNQVHESYKNITNILACPKCHGSLENLSCTQCHLNFHTDEGIFDLRYNDEQLD